MVELVGETDQRPNAAGQGLQLLVLCNFLSLAEVRLVFWNRWLVPLRPARWLQITLALLVGIAEIWFGARVLEVLQTSGFTDFDILFHSAQRVASGHSPYLRGLFNAPFGGYYKFPPLVALILAPLTVFDWIALAHAYALLGLVLYLITFVLLQRIVALPLGSPSFFLLALAFLLFQPTIDTLNGAQHEFVILLLFTLAYWGMLHPRYGEFVAGASFGIVVLIKLYPILILPYFVIRRAWRAVFALLGTIVGLMLFSIAVGGWDLQRQFWFLILPNLSGATAWLENQSFFAFFARLIVDGAAADPIRVTVVPFAMWAEYFAIVLSVVISFGVLLRDSRPEFAFSIWVPLTLLLGPNSWVHYEVLLLLPLAILLSEFRCGAKTWQWVLLLVATALIAFGNELTVKDIHWGWVQSYKFYGVLGFWGVAIHWAWTRSEVKESLPQILMRFRPGLLWKGPDART